VGFTPSRLNTWIQLESDQAQTIANSYNWVMDHLPGQMAIRRIETVQSLARQVAVKKAAWLRELIPTVFGDEPIGVRIKVREEFIIAGTPQETKRHWWWSFG